MNRRLIMLSVSLMFLTIVPKANDALNYLNSLRAEAGMHVFTEHVS